MALTKQDVELFNSQFQRVINANDASIKTAITIVSKRIDRLESENELQIMLLKSLNQTTIAIQKDLEVLKNNKKFANSKSFNN